MLNLLVVFLSLSAMVNLVAIIVVLSLWLHGSSSVVFPDLGIVVATGFLLLMLIAVESMLVFSAAYLARSKWDAIFGVMQVRSNE